MKNKKILGVVALAAVTAVGGSFAYFNQTMVAENPFNTGTYDTTMQESFNPADGENWEPGVTVPKSVAVKNNGNQPVVVRARFDETWTRRDGGDSKTITAEEVAMSGTGKKITTVAEEGQLTDGDWSNDDSVVQKNLATQDKWILGADGWYYYVGTVAADGGSSDAFLDSVTLIPNLDLGTEAREYTYTMIKDGKTETGNVPADCIDPDTKKVDLKKLADKDHLDLKKGDELTTDVKVGIETGTGYSNADYVLTITTQTVQATSAAIEDAFKGTYDSWQDAVGKSAAEMGWDFAVETAEPAPEA